MLRRSLLIVSVLLGLATASVAGGRDPRVVPPGDYALDPARAELKAVVPILGGVSRYTMRFSRLSGGFALSPGGWATTKVVIDVDPRSIVAEDRLFSRAAVEQFEPDRFPVIRFASTRLILSDDGRGRLEGDLLMHGVTRPVTLDVTFESLGATRVRFTGSGEVRRSAFGMVAARPFAADRIALAFDVEFARR